MFTCTMMTNAYVLCTHIPDVDQRPEKKTVIIIDGFGVEEKIEGWMVEQCDPDNCNNDIENEHFDNKLRSSNNNASVVYIP